MYLGRSLSLGLLHDAELTHRINCGWAKFHANKKELCSRHYPPQDRLRLCEATVTPSVLYACGTWTMTRARARLLRVAQRRMLRTIVGVGRRTAPKRVEETSQLSETSADISTASADNESEIDDPAAGETWVDWIRRATQVSEALGAKARITDWTSEQRRRKFLWAGHLSRRTDGRWSAKSLLWTPSGGSRKVGHPTARWADCIDAFFKTMDIQAADWITYAGDRHEWMQLSSAYCRFCCGV
jgi:hypothetical protein